MSSDNPGSRCGEFSVRADQSPDCTRLATPIIGDGFLADDPTADAILFTARSSKFPNGPILSTGSSMLFNTEKDEYRLLWLRADINHTAIHADEGVESDVCVTVVPQSTQNSVSSGEELFCTHEHYYGGDGKSVGPSLFDFGPGGFPLGPNTKLDIASVSKIYGAARFSPLTENMVRSRDAPAEPVMMPFGEVTTSLDLLALNFEALIVPSDVKDHVGLRSVRSPLRDRSVVPLPYSEVMPFTEFKNVKSEPVTIVGLGIFRSMLGHYVAGDTLIRVIIGDKEVHRLCPVSHRPNEVSASFDAVVPLSATVPTGSTIRVEHNLTAHWPETPRVYKPTPYDLAVYILYERSDVSSDAAMVPTGEEQLGNGQLDLNNDGFPDYVDYDKFGNIWADLTSPDGAHDTQHTAITTLITKKGKFNTPTTEWNWTRNVETGLMEARIRNEHENWCFYLRSRTESNFFFEYCDESAVPYKTLLGSTTKLADYCVGDFDGDGFMDRLRMERGVIRHSLYFASGDGSRYVSERKVGIVKGKCIYEQPKLEAVYKPSAQRHVFGYFSRCGFFEVDLRNLI